MLSKLCPPCGPAGPAKTKKACTRDVKSLPYFRHMVCLWQLIPRFARIIRVVIYFKYLVELCAAALAKKDASKGCVAGGEARA